MGGGAADCSSQQGRAPGSRNYSGGRSITARSGQPADSQHRVHRMTPNTTASWNAATSAPGLAPVREGDMTEPTIAAWASWWTGPAEPDFIAREIVGPLAIADLVAVHFDHRVLRDRLAAGIRTTDDFLTLRVLLACRPSARTVAELGTMLGFSESGIRRAVRHGYDVGALVAGQGRRHRTHEVWRPAGRRLVAVELKRTDWRRAAQQGWAYLAWANTSWLVLGQRPTRAAVECLTDTGLGLAYLGDDERLHRVLRPRTRRRPTGSAGVWAGEQALANALSSGLDPLTAVKPARATLRAPLASIAH